MKLVRIIVCILTVVSIIAMIFFKLTDTTDYTIPVITKKEENIEISVNDSTEKILSFVSAYDEKDGDLSDRIFIENITPYISSGRADITYVVCDNDNNVGKLLVNVLYSDYHSPRFYLKKPLLIGYKSKNFNVKDYVGVIDCLDTEGTASDDIIAITDCITSSVGDYSLDVRITNSKFDIASLLLSVTVSAKSTVNPIKLSRYLIYCKVGESVDYLSYVNRIDEALVTVDTTKVDLNTPGVYEATYYLEGKDATSFFIVCEE